MAHELGPADTAVATVAADSALASSASVGSTPFERIVDNIYLGGAEGYVGNDEFPVCDCKVVEDAPLTEHSCGADSNCINRELFIECSDNCPCGSFCQNQRFARRQYAPMEVFDTKKKGMGLRATSTIRDGNFIIEYCGEVITSKIFKKRVIEYSEKKIPHFYFMSLKSNEYIDALKKGNISRYMNHSCNPNCELHRWIVQNHWRIGLFATRDIADGEELTFDYKFENYGQEAQPCYCGEANCKGWIGGKQSDRDYDIDFMSSAANSDVDLDEEEYDDGVSSDQFETLADVSARKRKKKKRAKKDSDDEEYMDGKLYSGPKIPLEQTVYYKPGMQNVNDVKNVCRTLRISLKKPQSISQALDKIEKTASVSMLRKFLWTHGIELLKTCITTYMEEKIIICMQVLRILKKLPINSKNSSSKIENEVELLTKVDDVMIADLAKEVLQGWSDLTTVYKIPKRTVGESMSQSSSFSSLKDFTSTNNSNSAELLKKSQLANAFEVNSRYSKSDSREKSADSKYSRDKRSASSEPVQTQKLHDNSKKFVENGNQQITDSKPIITAESVRRTSPYDNRRTNNNCDSGRPYSSDAIKRKESLSGSIKSRDSVEPRRPVDYDHPRDRYDQGLERDRRPQDFNRGLDRNGVRCPPRDFDRPQSRGYEAERDLRNRDPRGHPRDWDRDNERGPDYNRRREYERDARPIRRERDEFAYDNHWRNERNERSDRYGDSRQYERNFNHPSDIDRNRYNDKHDYPAAINVSGRPGYRNDVTGRRSPSPYTKNGRRRSDEDRPPNDDDREKNWEMHYLRVEQLKRRRLEESGKAHLNADDLPETTIAEQFSGRQQGVHGSRNWSGPNDAGHLADRHHRNGNFSDSRPQGTNPVDRKLLPGWKVATADDGARYYYHEKTRETRWTPPLA